MSKDVAAYHSISGLCIIPIVTGSCHAKTKLAGDKLAKFSQQKLLCGGGDAGTKVLF